MTVSRRDAREALAAYLTGTIIAATAVYPYQVADFAGQSPIVYITSSGSERTKLTGQGYRSMFKLNVHSFVLYPSKATDGYTEQDAENILDEIEHQVADAFLSIANNPVIKAISYGETSNADNTIEIGGETYLHEIMPVEVYCIG